jgi:hypothetical protein
MRRGVAGPGLLPFPGNVGAGTFVTPAALYKWGLDSGVFSASSRYTDGETEWDHKSRVMATHERIHATRCRSGPLGPGNARQGSHLRQPLFLTVR